MQSTSSYPSSPHAIEPGESEMEGTAALHLPSQDEPSNFMWDWSDLFDFSIGEQLGLPLDSDHPLLDPPLAAEPAPISPTQPSPPDSSGRVRKRDPRLTCSNFLAGRVPCACPEMDEKLEEEEGDGRGKKRPKSLRVSAGMARCQVPGCEADIRELKGYHRRHRICIQCANASAVDLDGQSKRYCQQCGKFHILSDFDEGKRSCRRKLERHNNRRRRKPTGSKMVIDKGLEQVLSAEDVACDVDNVKGAASSADVICQTARKGTILESEGQISTISNGHGSQNIQSNSVLSFAASSEQQINSEKNNSQNTLSPSYCDNKSPYSSACPTGRISFKLYDWNPAEFPRRLRLQIFEWLASMPVELEGYIRPGCTIFTVFMAMPNFMWVKLFEDPDVYIQDLVFAPGSILSGRGTLFVYLNNMVFRVMKEGASVMKVNTREHAPKLHYVHPTCFEAGKPIEFVACGSNLLQPKFRLLVSFDGKYLAHEFCIPSRCSKTEGETSTSCQHQSFRIRVPHTKPDLFGPAFIEVENESGLSNFIPILIGNKSMCSEVALMQQRFETSLSSEESPFTDSSFPCEVSGSRQRELSELILDMAWLLKKPVWESIQHTPTSSQIQRFNLLLGYLMKNESIFILERVLHHMEIMKGKNLPWGIADIDTSLFKKNLKHARDLLSQKLQDPVLHLSIPVLDGHCIYQSSQYNALSVVPTSNQNMEVVEEDKLGAIMDLSSPNRSDNARLLTGEVVMRVNHIKEQQRRSCRQLHTQRVILTSRPLMYVIAAAALCVGLCAVLLHPQKVGKLATTIRRCLIVDS